MNEAQRQKTKEWLAQWPVGSRGRHLISQRVYVGVTVEAHELRRGGWPSLRLRDEMGHTRWCSYGGRGHLVPEKEDSRG